MQSRLVQLQLHNPVRAKVVMEKLAGAQSLCASNGFVFVCTADGIVVTEHTRKRAIQSIQKNLTLSMSLRRGESRLLVLSRN